MMEASRLCGPRAMRQDTDTTLITCLAGRGTRYNELWTRGATLLGAQNFKRRVFLRAIRAPKNPSSMSLLMVVSAPAWRIGRRGTSADSEHTGLETLPGNLTVN